MAVPEPDLDEVVVALHRVPASTVLVERRAVAVHRSTSLDTTAIVALAIIVTSGTSHGTTAGGHGATGIGVKSDLVTTLVVDTLNLR